MGKAQISKLHVEYGHDCQKKTTPKTSQRCQYSRIDDFLLVKSMAMAFIRHWKGFTGFAISVLLSYHKKMHVLIHPIVQST